MAQESFPRKQKSALYPPDVVSLVRENVATNPWAASVRDKVIEAARTWYEMDDEELWHLMFGPTLTRSWMVWSNGYSPATGDPVPMYNWIIDGHAHPWKVKCPHSGELFPKNDFKAYYDSGLNKAGYFDPERADRSLLFNTEHPDPTDPLHKYGVDDGQGYVNEKGETWRFIATYLIYGQWKQVVLGGIRNLSAAYVLTGDTAYARKAGVLMDRTADFYPEFSFKDQGVMYEGPASHGYVSTWHDACEETRELVMGYDMIFDGIRRDEELVQFLNQKASEIGLENPKSSFEDIQRNIEGRILRDCLLNKSKIHSNFPRSEITQAITLAVLNEPAEKFWELVDPMIDRATAVDGVTGEKGLAGYSSYTISGLAMFLAEFPKADPEFIPAVLKRHPQLRQTYRFFIDMRILDRYYPLSGDTGYFAGPVNRYVGMNFAPPGVDGRRSSVWTVLAPSSYRLLWNLYEATGDVAYAQTLYQANNRELDGLPYDLYGVDPSDFQRGLKEVIEQEGEEIALGSVNKEEWHLAILRSGKGKNRRALWLDYDSGGGHGHADGMNLGLFGHGLDLLPELGYPPVQFGGWSSPRATWYKMSAAHNTVVVDGQNSGGAPGRTRLWADGEYVHAITVDGATLNQGRRFERTALLVDVSDEVFYVVDMFRVAGGKDHTRFMHSHFGEIETTSLNLQPAETYGHSTQMRNMRAAKNPEDGWQIRWDFEDRYELIEKDRKIGMLLTDWTRRADVAVCEGWVVAGMFSSNKETWIPRVLTRSISDDGDKHETTFVSILEPFEEQPVLGKTRRLTVRNETGVDVSEKNVGLEILLPNGFRDIVLVKDTENSSANGVVSVEGSSIETSAPLGFARMSPNGEIVQATIVGKGHLRSGEVTLECGETELFAEWNR